MDVITRLKKYRNRSFTVAEARHSGVQPFTLVYLVRSGQLKRMTSGLYAFPDYAPTELKDVISDLVKVVPQAVVGLDSALQLYGLTDQLVEDITLIVPSSNVPKRRLEGVVFHQRSKNFEKMEIHKINRLPVTSINQTIVDLLKDDRPLSMVVDIFSQAQQRRELSLSISKIKELSGIFRVKTRGEILLQAVG